MPNEFSHRWDRALRKSAAVSLTVKAELERRPAAAGPAGFSLLRTLNTTQQRLPNGRLQGHDQTSRLLPAGRRAFGIHATPFPGGVDACKPVRAFTSTPLATTSAFALAVPRLNDRMSYGQEVMG